MKPTNDTLTLKQWSRTHTYHTAHPFPTPRALDKHGPVKTTTAWKLDPGQTFDIGSIMRRSQDRR